MPATRLDPTPDTLADLLERIQGADPAALRSLYELTASKLFGLALHIVVRREWAEEVLQDSFVNIWRHAGDYRAATPSAPMTSLAAIVRNRALDHLRRVRAHDEDEDEGEGESESDGAMARFDRPVEPPAAIWLAIESRLDLAAATRGGFDAPQPGMPAANTRRRPGRGWDTLGFWRGLSGVALAVAIVSIGIALRTAAPAAPAGVPVAPRIGYVSVLHDDRSNSTLLVTWDDAHSTVTLQRLSDVPVPGGHDLQLWGIASSGPPASLGVLPKQGAASFKVAYRPQNYGVLAISVEPAGGSPNPNGPTGPLIYTGKLVPTS